MTSTSRRLVRPAGPPALGGLEVRDRVDLDQSAAGEGSHLYRRACGRPIADAGAVHGVQLLEVSEVGQEDRHLEEVLEARAGLLEDRLQVVERLLGLLGDSALDGRAGRR